MNAYGVRLGLLLLLAGTVSSGTSSTTQGRLDIRVLIKSKQPHEVGALMSPHFTDKETEAQLNRSSVTHSKVSSYKAQGWTWKAWSAPRAPLSGHISEIQLDTIFL